MLKAAPLAPSVLLAIQLVTSFSAEACSVLDQYTSGSCGDSDGTSVVLEARENQRGVASDPVDRTAPNRTDLPEPPACDSTIRACYTVTAPGEVPAGTPAITLSDLVSFRPAVGEQRMEPNGWSVTGLQANFLGDDQADMVPGQLLGQPASVRFEPVSWTWDYGDGASRTSASPGSTWQQLGLDEFEPTATSHAFDAPGTYTVRLTVSYSAAYSFGGGGWVPVTGTVAAEAAPITVVVGDADTVLVEHPCTVDSTAPGC